MIEQLPEFVMELFSLFLHFQRLKQYFKFDNPRHHNISSNTDTTETVMDR